MKTLIIASLLMASQLLAKGEAPTLNYYFIPFQIETYVPVTQENIKEKAENKGKVSESDASIIIDLLSEKNQKANFDRKRVRLLVKTQDVKIPIFVDAAGTVLKGEEEYALTPKAFEALKKILNRKKVVPQ